MSLETTTPILYTHSGEVREMMSASPRDVNEELFVTGAWAKMLKVHLDSWLSDHEAIFNDGSASGATEEEQSKKTLLQLYCAAWVGVQLLQNTTMWLPQSLGDGKSSAKRYPEVDLLLPMLQARLQSFRSLLLDALDRTDTAIGTSLTLFTAVGSSYDPVTGA